MSKKGYTPNLLGYMFGPLSWLELAHIENFFTSLNKIQMDSACYSVEQRDITWDYAVSWTTLTNDMYVPSKLLVSHKKAEPVDIIIDWYYRSGPRVSFPHCAGITIYTSDFVHDENNTDDPLVPNGEREFYKKPNTKLWKIVAKFIEDRGVPTLNDHGFGISIDEIGYNVLDAAKYLAILVGSD